MTHEDVIAALGRPAIERKSRIRIKSKSRIKSEMAYAYERNSL